jgi:hypothetical protein
VQSINDQINHVAEILGADISRSGEDLILRVGTTDGGPTRLVLTIADSVDENGPHGAVISAQTTYGYFELHEASGLAIVEPGEVIFYAEEGDRISGMIVGASGNCSLFANVDRAILSADFTTLDAPRLLAAMQLGLIELADANGRAES